MPTFCYSVLSLLKFFEQDPAFSKRDPVFKICMSDPVWPYYASECLNWLANL